MTYDKQQWISVKDRLPETNCDVLVTDGYNYDIAYYGNLINQWFFQDGVDDFVSHWMPLPKLPQP
jgi:hypothetical protein